MKKISIVVACYNEFLNIEPMHTRVQGVFKNLDYRYELIFVDNASTDQSRQLYQKIISQDSNVKALMMSRNFGSSQPSFFAGIQNASGDAVVLIDGDLQDPPEVIPDLIQKWESGFDVVYAVRKKRKGSILRRIGYTCFYRIFRWLSYINIPLDAGDFSIMDRKVVDVIKSLNEKDLYLRGLRSWAGFKQAGIEYVRQAREGGESNNSFLQNFNWAKKAITNFSYKPLEFISKLAIFAMFMTFIASIVYLYLYFRTDAPRGFSTLLMVMFIFGTIQLLALSIIAEYLIRIFQEVKNRPPYVISEILEKKVKKYLITGGAGFIGANLARKLLENKENKIWVLVEKNPDLWRLQDVLDKINFIDTDLTDYNNLSDQIKTVKPDVIYHLAAYGGLPTQLEPNKIYDINFYGTVNLLNACKQVGFDCFINTGSSSEYGIKTTAMSEDDVLCPVSDYGVAKAAATQFCLKEALFNKLPVYTVRPFSVYGDFEMPGRLIPSVLVNAILKKPINLSGPDFVRDFIYVKDFVAFCIKLHEIKPQNQSVFNCGTGMQSTIKNVTDIVSAILPNIDICWGQSQPRPWEPNVWRANIDKAVNFVGWRPEYSLSYGLRESLNWFEKNIKYYVNDYEKQNRSKFFVSRSIEQRQSN